MADAYMWADMVVARAGAGTLAELALAALPALLVPLADAAADHQVYNARVWQQRGAALMVRETEWTATGAADALSTVLGREGRWHAMADAMRSLARPGAAHAVVRDCEQLMAGRW
jgi:UDP-N-acetylglucosamine--N-acetylmuramyl-(pentapeptide) pyrophosphoryl-undecaprenol N-acetylglucosamine transferase